MGWANSHRHDFFVRQALVRLTFATLALVTLGTAVAEAQRGYGGERPGVTLYEHEGFRGRSVKFFEDDPYLKDNPLGQDWASSAEVDPGCEVTLYEDIDYGGRSATLWEDVARLSNVGIGNDRVSSVRVYCERRGNRGQYGNRDSYGNRDQYDNRDYRDQNDYGYNDSAFAGVTLFAGVDYSGRSEIFVDDDNRLNNNTIGDNAALSLQLSPGCQVTVYDSYDYGGRSVTYTQSVRDITQTRFGRVGVSSIRVDCSRATTPRPPGNRVPAQRRGVTLYRDNDYRGRSETFYVDHPDLRSSSVGQDSVSSLRVDPGCQVTLFRDVNFRGPATTVEYDTPSLRRTNVGNDEVSSLRIECRGRRY